jgi:hypothetical protein
MAELIDDYVVPRSSLGALRTFLLDHAPVIRLLKEGGDIFVNGITKDKISKTPINCINLVHGGGPEDKSEAPKEEIRVYVCCYGENSNDADSLDKAVLIPLKRLRGAVRNGVYIHWAKPGGPTPGFDPHTDWPYVRRSYLVNFGWEVG